MRNMVGLLSMAILARKSARTYGIRTQLWQLKEISKIVAYQTTAASRKLYEDHEETPDPIDAKPEEHKLLATVPKEYRKGTKELNRIAKTLLQGLPKAPKKEAADPEKGESKGSDRGKGK